MLPTTTTLLLLLAKVVELEKDWIDRRRCPIPEQMMNFQSGSESLGPCHAVERAAAVAAAAAP